MPKALTANIPPIPGQISRDTLRAVCDLLGLPADELRTLEIDPGRIVATLWARDEHGILIAGDDGLYFTVSIPVG